MVNKIKNNLIHKNMNTTKCYKSVTICSETTSTSGESSPSRTLVIFDFDDTLFCTKYLDTFSLSYKDIFSCKISLEEINPCLVKEIKDLESAIIELFIKLQEYNYDIIIISNADLKWINNCLTHFLEEFQDFINENKIKIFSAKTLFSQQLTNPAEWKIKCFQNVIFSLYSLEGNNTLNVLSIGDGDEEKKALFKLNKNPTNNSCLSYLLKTKFIQMISYPSATSIIMQLQYLKNNIHKLVLTDKSYFKMKIELINNTAQIKCVSISKKNKKSQSENKCINFILKNIYPKEQKFIFQSEYKNFVFDKNYENFNEKENEITQENSIDNAGKEKIFLGKKTYLNYDE